jgi:hypothetical protein
LAVVVVVGGHVEVDEEVVREGGTDVGSVELKAEEDEAAEGHDPSVDLRKGLIP